MPSGNTMLVVAFVYDNRIVDTWDRGLEGERLVRLAVSIVRLGFERALMVVARGVRPTNLVLGEQQTHDAASAREPAALAVADGDVVRKTKVKTVT
eukprot:3685554-Prymnesium_polylepis.2